jgi:cell shape-determining protein MreC
MTLATPILVFVLGGLFTLLAFLFQRTIIKYMDDMKSEILTFRQDFQKFKDDCFDTFVKKEDCKREETFRSELMKQRFDSLEKDIRNLGGPRG